MTTGVRFRDYLDEYTTLNQGTIDGKPQSYYSKMPSVKLTIRSMYSGTVMTFAERLMAVISWNVIVLRIPLRL